MYENVKGEKNHDSKITKNTLFLIVYVRLLCWCHTYMTSNSPPSRGLEGFSQSYPQRTWHPSSAGCLRCHAGHDCQEPDRNQQVKYMSSFSIHDCILNIFTDYQQIQKSMSCIIQQVHACDAICKILEQLQSPII